VSRTEAGRVFQTRGPAMLNDRSPIAVRDLGTSSRAALTECMPISRQELLSQLNTVEQHDSVARSRNSSIPQQAGAGPHTNSDTTVIQSFTDGHSSDSYQY